MHYHAIKTRLLLGLFFSLFALVAFSQKLTVVKGTVLDADTKDPVPFATVAFKGTSIGTDTDFDGKFILETKFPSDSVVISFLGYEDHVFAVEKGTRQRLTVELIPAATLLNTVEVVAKEPGRIKKKNNPAVKIMREVIKRKDENRIEGQAFYEFDKYEKVQFDLNNFDPDKMRKRRAFKKFQFLFDFVDTSELNGKPFLPFFIQEISSKVYYRKNPESKKEYRSAVKVTSLEDYMEIDDLTTMMDVVYRDIDIYDNNITLLDLSFMGPLNRLAPDTYNMFLVDTAAVVNGREAYRINLFPRVKGDLVFKGAIYIQKGTYAVLKADLGIAKGTNLNFVQDLKLEQEFDLVNGVWVLTKDRVQLDFGLFKKGTGIYGTRDVSYKDFIFGEKRENDLYDGTEQVVELKDAKKRDDSYWADIRHDTLSSGEKDVYRMIDTLQNAPAFKTMMEIFKLAFTGYKSIGKFDLGPIGNFYSYNPVEGWRLKLGGETNRKFHPKLQLAGYGAYGLDDEEWKYGASIEYSFREDFVQNPKHYLRLSYQHDVNLVGQILPFSSADNFFLSFQRGNRSRMLFLDKYQANYFLELPNNLSFDFSYTNTNQRPIGTMALDFTNSQGEPASLPEFRTSEVGLVMRFAPNEQFVQGRSYRLPFYNKFPVFTLTLTKGLEDVLGGDYNYGSARLNIFKRFYFSLLGTMRFEAEGGKYFGNGTPYFLLNLPRANQSFAYRTGAFNMMNYQEFVNDQYFSISIEHYFKGFFFNKIPLLKKLKLREVVTFKGIYGGLTDNNDPNALGNESFIQFVRNNDGEPVTYTLEDKPYMEASVGIMNILKFGRIDVVRRLTYLDNPEVPEVFGVRGLGVRAKLAFEF